MPSAVVSVASSGDNTVIAAQGAGTFIRVFGFSLVCASSVNATWKNGAAALTGAYPFPANGGISRSQSNEPIFTLSENTALVLNLSAAVQTSGEVTYVVLKNN